MHIVFVGQSGIPNAKTATNNRIMSFKNMLESAKVNVSVLNHFYTNKIVDENIYYSSIFKSKPANKFLQVVEYFVSYISDALFLLKMNKNKKINVLLVYTGSFSLLLFYRFLSSIIGCKLVFQYVEYRSHLRERSVRFKLNDYLFDNYSFYFTHGIIVISEYLKNRVLQKKWNLKIIKIPAICDFSVFNKIHITEKENYFLYCGTIAYFEVILFVINAFLSANLPRNFKLKLIVSGDNIDKISKYIINNDRIDLVNNLTYTELIVSYKKSIALLIPLRNTIQDKARFPHKISEYTASGSAIISTNIGEITYYFNDGQNALLTDTYSISEYAKKMEYIANNIEEVKKMGTNGYTVGLSNFDEHLYTNSLLTFFLSL
jgi:glycosyltransferase involved in cell wall biosynthesis